MNVVLSSTQKELITLLGNFCEKCCLENKKLIVQLDLVGQGTVREQMKIDDYKIDEKIIYISSVGENSSDIELDCKFVTDIEYNEEERTFIISFSNSVFYFEMPEFDE